MTGGLGLGGLGPAPLRARVVTGGRLSQHHFDANIFIMRVIPATMTSSDGRVEATDGRARMAVISLFTLGCLLQISLTSTSQKCFRLGILRATNGAI